VVKGGDLISCSKEGQAEADTHKVRYESDMRRDARRPDTICRAKPRKPKMARRGWEHKRGRSLNIPSSSLIFSSVRAAALTARLRSPGATDECISTEILEWTN
jgi:hypothetical protein